MSWPEVSVTRISSIDYRKTPPSKIAAQAQNRHRKIAEVLSVVAPAVDSAPFFLDDSMRGLNAGQWASYIMRSDSEFFIVRSGGRLLGFHVLEAIKLQRHAIWHAFLPAEAGLTKHRVASVIEVLKYAFSEAGLGLLKVKCHVTADNQPAIRMLNWFGAEEVGRLRFETSHGGRPHDTLIFEILNPLLTAVEEPINEVEPERPEYDQPSAGGDGGPILQLPADVGAELRQLGDEPSGGLAGAAATDSGADDAVGAGSGEAPAGRPESEWYSVLAGGTSKVGAVLQDTVPEPGVSQAEG